MAGTCWVKAGEISGTGFRATPLPTPAGKGVGFTRMTGSSGIDFSNVLTEKGGSENQIRMNGSGVALGDVDGDGWVDIYLCGLEGENRLYRNLGNWRFEDVTEQAGVGCPDQFSTGAVFADVNGNGHLDLLVNSLGGGTRLFLNDGSGRFTEKIGSGLFRRFGSSSLALADINGNGWLDLYVANYRTTTIRTTGFALLNVGGRRMVRPQDRGQIELTPSGLILEHGEIDMVYHNQGGERFRAVRWHDGTFSDANGSPLESGYRDWGLAVMFRDITGNGAPDIYVCNDFHSPDRIWINDGQGRFQPVPPLALRNTSTFSMAIDFADIDRDGWDDFFVADMLDMTHRRRMIQFSAVEPDEIATGDIFTRPQFDRNTLHWNRGDGTFAEIARFSGLQASGWTWGVVFLDVDLDGYEDLLMTTGHMFDPQDADANQRIHDMGPFPIPEIPKKVLLYPPLPMANVAFRNLGDLTFEETGSTWGFDFHGVSHGIALADLDNDGDLDVVVNNLNAPAGIYRNDSTAPRVAVRLKGAPPNTQGIGAKIWLFNGAVPIQSQEVISGGRYLSGDDPMRVFAAGNSTSMKLVVRWRSGKKSIIEKAKPNYLYQIEEPGD
jgi:enediyne biosynthesis protein E4